MTVLFADLVDSTRLVEHLGAGAFRSLQQKYFATLRECIKSHSGVVEKYAGDAVMAIFGVAGEERPQELALAAALDILDLTDVLADDFDRMGVKLAVRVGIESGVASVGEPMAGQLLAAGDVVIRAARLQQNGEPGAAILGERAQRGAAPDPLSTAVQFRGKSMIVRPKKATLTRALRNPDFVNRTQELATLTRHFESVHETGRTRCVVVDGPSGIGKAALVTAVVRSNPTDRVFTGRFLPYGLGFGLGWFPALEVIGDVLGLHDNDSAPEALRKAQDVLGASCGEVPEDSLLGLMGYSDRPPAQDEGSRAFGRVIQAWSSSQPRVLVFQGCHWATPEALAPLRALLTLPEPAPLLVVCLTRDPGFAQRLGLSETAHVALGRLTDDHLAELIDPTTVNEFEESIIGAAVDFARGNPLAFQEAVWAQLQFQDDALLHEHARAPTRERALRQLVTSRLAELADEREVIERAAVRGKIFWRGDVLQGSASATSDVAFAALIKNGVLVPSFEQKEDVFAFRHSVLWEEAYRSIDEPRRRQLHQECGEWMAGALSHQWPYRAMAEYHLARAQGKQRSVLG